MTKKIHSPFHMKKVFENHIRILDWRTSNSCKPKMFTSIIYIYRGRPDISEFAEIAEKTHAISRFLAKILPVPISPIFLKIYISNYFLSVMNDVIFRIDFHKSSIFNFYLGAFERVLNSTHNLIIH